MALSVKRLRKENLSLQKEPVPLAIARPLESNILEWRFLIKGSDEYEGGFFQGRLIFPPQYPMKPPGIMFCTPSGRFEINRRVCMTISDFHPESWSPLWTVGTILTGIVSFFHSSEMTTGGLAASVKERKALAATSKLYNSKDKIYVELFGNDPPENLFEEADKIMNDIVKARIELNLKQKASAVPVPTNVKSVAIKSDLNSEMSDLNLKMSPEEDVLKVPVLTKSAKKRMKEKEKALRMKENGIDSELPDVESDGENNGTDDGEISGTV